MNSFEIAAHRLFYEFSDDELKTFIEMAEESYMNIPDRIKTKDRYTLKQLALNEEDRRQKSGGVK